jgi:hypothetical protein
MIQFPSFVFWVLVEAFSCLDSLSEHHLLKRYEKPKFEYRNPKQTRMTKRAITETEKQPRQGDKEYPGVLGFLF